MTQANVLIVEDELLIAKSIAKKLNKLGYNVVEIVASGREAIQYASKTSLDLILMDIAIKGKIDGIEAANYIKKIVDTPIIFLTAYASDETIERASKTGCYGYLIKPFRDKELQATVQMTLSKYREQSTIKKALNHSQPKINNEYDNSYRDEVTKLPNKLFLQDLFTYLSSLTNFENETESYSDFQLKSFSKNCEATWDSLSIAQQKRSHFQLIAVYNIYIAQLKQIANSLGQDRLNKLLLRIANRLSDCVNGFKTHGATVCLESDNLAVLLALDTRLTATQYGQAISERLNESFKIDGVEIFIEHNIGVAFCPSDGTELDELLQQSRKAIEFGVNKDDGTVEALVSAPEVYSRC